MRSERERLERMFERIVWLGAMLGAVCGAMAGTLTTILIGGIRG